MRCEHVATEGSAGAEVVDIAAGAQPAALFGKTCVALYHGSEGAVDLHVGRGWRVVVRV